jgi:putative GTP pyrophosphokinase
MENKLKTYFNTFPDKNIFRKEYEKYLEIRHLIVNNLKEYIEQILTPLHSNIVISNRIKNFDSFFSKYIRFLKTGEKSQINDLMGIRIICPFIEDLSAIEKIINEKLCVKETEIKGHYNFKEFGYESTHILIEIPKEFIKRHGNPGTDIVEIQIRTILQDAWAEVEHEFVYKADFSLFDEPMKRKLAAVNASLSLADIIFQEIRSHQRKYSKELDKRRESFFKKIEESIDDQIFNENESGKKSKIPIISNSSAFFPDNDNFSIDDLLVKALSAHNHKSFDEAINQYSKILELTSKNDICSIIYKHRGMAFFACSRYTEAIDDFSNSLKHDEKSYKVTYYRGVVYSVLRQYLPAINDYTLSLELYPYQPFCLFRRGQAYFHIGDYPQALADCENSLALDPQNISVQKFKELLHEKLKM